VVPVLSPPNTLVQAPATVASWISKRFRRWLPLYTATRTDPTLCTVPRSSCSH
jgi:hypothetical protein